MVFLLTPDGLLTCLTGFLASRVVCLGGSMMFDTAAALGASAPSKVSALSVLSGGLEVKRSAATVVARGT